MVLVGNCNCEAIRVTIDDSNATEQAPLASLVCHCTQCRRQSGGGGTYICIVDEDKVKIEGELKDFVDKKTDSGKELHRYFCGTCGCPVLSTSEVVPGKSVIKMGLFDTIPQAAAEWYCKNKMPWEPEVDGIPHAEKAG